MFFLFIHSAISYKNVYQLKKHEDYYVIPQKYYFQKGGKYSFEIKNAVNDVFILIGTKKVFDKFEDLYKTIKETGIYNKSLCEINQTFNLDKTIVIKTIDGYGDFTGSIDKDGLYYTVIASCDFSKFTLTFHLKFSNPNTNLSLNVEKCIKTFPIFIICISIIFIFWVILWIYYIYYTNLFHFLLTVFFIINIIDKAMLHRVLFLHNFIDSKAEIFDIYPKVFTVKSILLLNIELLSNLFFMLTKTKLQYLLLSTTAFSIFSIFAFYDFFDDKRTVLTISFLLISLFLIPLGIFGSWMNHIWHAINTFLIFVYFWFTIFIEYQFEISQFSAIYTLNIIQGVFEIVLFIFMLIVFHLEKEKWKKYYNFERNSNSNGNDNSNEENNLYIYSDVRQIKNNEYKFKMFKNVYFVKSSHLQIIGNDAFSHSKIESITIPSSVIQIGNYAFSSCEHLQNVDFEEISKIKVLESYIFSDSLIEYLYIPSSISILSNFWCENTKKLTNVSISQNNKYFAIFNDLVVGKNESLDNDYDILFFAPRNIKIVIIPPFIKQIATCAFQYCQNLKQIDFSNNSQLKTIGKFSFAFTSIEEISIPSSVLLFDDYSFYNCKKIKKVVLKNDSNLRIIGKYAFSLCSSLKSFVVPSHVMRIEENAFFNCDKLTTFEIKENSELISFDKNIFNESSRVVVFAPFKMTDFH